MKRYLLFASVEAENATGVQNLLGDYESPAEAFLALVDRNMVTEWWHVLDTQTGEVFDRQHVSVSQGHLGFSRSEWRAGSQPTVPINLPRAKGSPAGGGLNLEAELRHVVANGHPNGSGAYANGANGH